MKKFYYILFLLISLHSFSQEKFSLEVLTGVGINDKVSLINENIEDYTSFTTQVNANYKLKIYNNIYGETGLGFQYFFSSGTVLISNFRVSTLRLNVPFVLGYSFFDKAFLGGGIAISNNRDTNDIDFRANYNLRASLLLKAGYSLNNKVELLVITKRNVSDIPDLYYINHPKMDVSLGASFKLF